MSEKTTYSVIVHDISVTMGENTIKADLMGRYNGVEKVKRMFHNDKDATPKTSVRVYFTSAADIEKIRRDGNIVIGGICRQIYEPENSARQRLDGKPSQYSQNETKPLYEQDLINMFEEQKRLLKQVMDSFDEKLNNVITPQQDKTTKPVVSSNA